MLSKEENRILAIDFGLKRIGLALSDPLFTFSYPFKTILNDGKLWQNLRSIIKEKNVKKIILGYPLKSNGEKTHVTDSVLRFKKSLENNFSLEVIMWDESYTSEMAKQAVVQSVTKKSKRKDKGLIDRNSAAIILQEYLNESK